MGPNRLLFVNVLNNAEWKKKNQVVNHYVNIHG